MSSAGIKSRNTILPTSRQAENARIVDSSILSQPGLFEGTRESTGSIVSIHPEKPAIRVIDDSGSLLANNAYIPLGHSTLEIIERWGTIRKGMRVVVRFSGPSGGNSTAFIVGLEYEKNLNTNLEVNEAEQGLFKIFNPGIGG